MDRNIVKRGGGMELAHGDEELALQGLYCIGGRGWHYTREEGLALHKRGGAILHREGGRAGIA